MAADIPPGWEGNGTKCVKCPENFFNAESNSTCKTPNFDDFDGYVGWASHVNGAKTREVWDRSMEQGQSLEGFFVGGFV